MTQICSYGVSKNTCILELEEAGVGTLRYECLSQNMRSGIGSLISRPGQRDSKPNPRLIPSSLSPKGTEARTRAFALECRCAPVGRFLGAGRSCCGPKSVRSKRALLHHQFLETLRSCSQGVCPLRHPILYGRT